MNDPQCKRCWRPAAHNVYGFCPECMRQMAHAITELLNEGIEKAGKGMNAERVVNDLWETFHPRRNT